MKKPITIGVLALQGAFAKHRQMLDRMDVEVVEVRTPSDLARCHGLVIPGGESTTISKQIAYIGLDKPIRDFAKKYPVFGTCAGLILMAEQFNLLDVEVQRNGYGSQIESFTVSLRHRLRGRRQGVMKGIFIRAPRIISCGEGVDILIDYHDEPVAVQQGNHLAVSFHPELHDDDALHRRFLDIVRDTVNCAYCESL
ncbi:MAG: pyridoxal 5'-phosphate synthase glutaminase subunit PdxT [Chlamydiales bacterium]|nr:pyridoxal 5'-phosphate synthase glutaminase subunit PdxT [Chlamydiia bacterium]MCP5507742.1 pyridoxal 5'-phosphate synthase glutaminase subunit PdxT [Chlamydiales bacterium]